MQAAKKQFKIITYGCQMNKHDTEKIDGLLTSEGWENAPSLKEADLVVILTCCVRERAEEKVFGKLGELKRLKRNNPRLLIGVGGCMMQQEDNVERLKSSHAFVDFVFGTHNLHTLIEILKKAEKKRKPVIEIWEEKRGSLPTLPARRKDPHQAWVSIIHGCNNFCSYCIVPYVRGREVSRPFEEIIDEIKGLINDGVKEITLLGQNVNSYGHNLKEGINFSSLLEEIDPLPGLKRIRFTTSHPRDFSSQVIDTVARGAKICEHFHLPIQSGSNRILQRMNRGYTREHYLQLVKEIKNKIPTASITTDLIVGFPGETETDFKATLEVVEEVGFDAAFTFLYSPRKGTPAAKIKEQVDEEDKMKRFNQLLKLQNGISKKRNQAYIGKTVEVLGEGESKKDSKKQMGRTRTNKIVVFPSAENLRGQIIMVKIKRVQSWTLFGEALSSG